MIKSEISHEESVKENLETWCYEVGTRFEEVNKDAVQDFISFLHPLEKTVYELGCGDGAAGKEFVKNGFITYGIDINQEKLDKYPGIRIRYDIFDLLKKYADNSLTNIFTHHALEHMINADEIIKEISRVLRPGGTYYAIVPAKDYLHSVHHVVFESVEELLPPGLEVLELKEQFRSEAEYKCVARKQASVAK